MKAIVVTDEAAGTGGMTLADRPVPEAGINDVIGGTRSARIARP
ncbi:hypothetical protein [Sphingomonas oligoaromativorans]|nr:hypothetical protein [Sphingomonas oligoaromativorans]NIJ32696.1 hypothetical protein [Sphingomonas oligoaromativorans]